MIRREMAAATKGFNWKTAESAGSCSTPCRAAATSARVTGAKHARPKSTARASRCHTSVDTSSTSGTVERT
eukprot:CAMPEP_0181230210 /NCGR_PEP_ID=MMETSP1096-20121128/34338_1 /TAXON_ID=156174 ORGANISM="Chrysochromulina ericina, Strain CCMP281" /NCGR_SAMPLE_ID=MMETSP1096 /ASSEMBLY_ACC=CAM_ASM_000453 /LENGTH=70 /DNA_ID=CAMNT_0023323943 /DNA_START=265 /DNA_END=477 /DNA_ORIENTATION=+